MEGETNAPSTLCEVWDEITANDTRIGDAIPDDAHDLMQMLLLLMVPPPARIMPHQEPRPELFNPRKQNDSTPRQSP